MFGNPRRIIRDWTTAFTSNNFKHYCDSEKIEHILITTDMPRSNGEIERINRIVIPLFTKLSARHPENWYKYDRVQQFINSMPSRSTVRLTRLELLIGQNMRLRVDTELNKVIEKDIHCKRNDQRCANERKKPLKRFSAKSATVIIESEKQWYRYRIELVAIKRTQVTPGSKFCAKFLRSYEIIKVIIKVLRGDRYVVVKIGEYEESRITSTLADHMKR